MKKILFFFSACILLTNSYTFAQENEQTNQSEVLLDSLISLAKQYSYFSSNVDWEELETEMISISKEYDSTNKLGKPAELMFKALGDYHGMLMYDYSIAFNHRLENNGPPNDSTYRTIGLTKIHSPYRVHREIIEETTIAYIEILATGVMQGEQITLARDEIRTAICELKENKPTGWIIDLRSNIGGNMNPMLAGLGELIPNADLGGDTKDGENFYSTWKFKNGNFYENGNSYYQANLTCKNSTTEGRIAVLTSKYTASAGEVVVSSLKGQKNLKIIGQKTSGLSSTNGWFILSDKWIFAPMTAYYMSKEKTVHSDGVIPDFIVEEALDLDNLQQGKIIDRAIQWIKKGD